MHRFRALLLFIIILVFFYSILLQPAIQNNLNISYDNSINDPFMVHSFNNSCESRYYLNKNNYYIDIASANHKDFYLNVSGNGVSLNLYSNKWEFHGFYINESGIYYFNTSGSGRYLISMSAQDPGFVYKYNINMPTSFVLVPALIDQNRIEIETNGNYRILLYNSLLEPLKCSNKGRIYYNITSKQYNGVDFITLYANMNTLVLLSWGAFHARHNLKYNIIEIILPGFIISIYIIFRITKKNYKNKRM